MRPQPFKCYQSPFRRFMLKSLQRDHDWAKNHNTMNQTLKVYLLIAMGLLWGCASPETPKENKEFSVLEEEQVAEVAPQRSPSYEKLMALATSLGYQAIGLEHEDDATLDFIFKVLSNPRAQNRKIALIYTGLQLSYDKSQFSLTFGEDFNLEKTLKFIEKNISAR